MGNQRFRLWDMIMPNAWFYKLKDMANLHHHPHHHHKIASKKPHPPSSSSSSLNNHPPKSGQRKSYHFTRDLKPHPDSPSERSYSSRRRRSTRRRGRPYDTHPPLISSSISTGSSFRDDDALEDMTSSCRNCKADLSPRDLPPIITKKQQHDHRSTTTRQYNRNPSSVSSPGVKLRTNSPRIGNLRGRRRSVSESFAVVKSSRDPVKDFRESMVEMIVENNIQGTRELEELLACYLTLNADEYHDLIISVFKQIWFDFIRFRLN